VAHQVQRAQPDLADFLEQLASQDLAVHPEQQELLVIQDCQVQQVYPELQACQALRANPE
jgi:hypothetical protein